MLTLDYTVPQVQRPDAFLRGFSDVLRDLSSEEYGALVQVVTMLSEHAGVAEQGRLHIALSDEEAPQVSIQEPDGARGGTTTAPPLCGSVLDLLVDHHLAVLPAEFEGAYFRDGNAPRVAWGHKTSIEVTTVARMRSVLDRARDPSPA